MPRRRGIAHDAGTLCGAALAIATYPVLTPAAVGLWCWWRGAELASALQQARLLAHALSEVP